MDKFDYIHVLAALIPLILLFYVVYVRCATPLRKIPGPALASVTRLWKLYAVLRGDFEWTNIHLHQQYGQSIFFRPAFHIVT